MRFTGRKAVLLGSWLIGALALLAPASNAQEKDEAKKADAPAKDAPKEAVKEAPKEAPKEATKEAAKEAPKEAPKTPPAPAKTDAPAASAVPAAPASPLDAVANFEKKLGEWKTVLKDLRALHAKYQSASAAEGETIRKQWDELVKKGEGLMGELRALGKAAYSAVPTDRQTQRFLVKMAEDDCARDDYEPALELAQLLIEKGCDQKEIFNSAGIAAFCTGDFEKADEYFKKADEAKVLAGDGQKYKSSVEEYKKLGAEEAALRKAEAEKNDLPQVKLQTSKGEIIVELFENEAPETVGNFVSLVEAKFYDGKIFHRVLNGFMAQGGCPEGSGRGGPGYNIYCETQKPNARKHFRGSLSMAHAGKDTGGSQFFLTFVPTPHLNGGHTVFGRVIKGMDVLAKLQRLDPDAPNKPQPDMIVKAEVIRKRDHKYEPNKVK